MLVGAAKEAGYYVVDMSRCGKNIHLGRDRWKYNMYNKRRGDVEWNVPYYMSKYTKYNDMASAADYVATRYSMYSKLYIGRNKRRLPKLIKQPFYVLTPPPNAVREYNKETEERIRTKSYRTIHSRRYREAAT